MKIHQPSKVSLVLMVILSFCLNSAFPQNPIGNIHDSKHTNIAMRLIGDEFLKKMGDTESRVLPITVVNGTYKISFEREFTFLPDDLIAIVADVMKKAEISADYVVEVQQCQSEKEVYVFASGLQACMGRELPEDCYNIIVSFPEVFLAEQLDQKLNNELGIKALENKETNSFTSVFLLLPLVLLLALIIYFVNKKNPELDDPNMIRIGDILFNTKNMVLSFQEKSIELSHKEGELLTVLHESLNNTVERELILRRVWGDDGDYIGRTLDVFISKLRKKLAADDSVKILNVRGVGYKLVA